MSTRVKAKAQLIWEEAPETAPVTRVVLPRVQVVDGPSGIRRIVWDDGRQLERRAPAPNSASGSHETETVTEPPPPAGSVVPDGIVGLIDGWMPPARLGDRRVPSVAQLRAWHEASGKTINEVCSAIGAPGNVVSQNLSGKLLSVDTRQRMAHFYGYSNPEHWNGLERELADNPEVINSGLRPRARSRSRNSNGVS